MYWTASVSSVLDCISILGSILCIGRGVVGGIDSGWSGENVLVSENEMHGTCGDAETVLFVCARSLLSPPRDHFIRVSVRYMIILHIVRVEWRVCRAFVISNLPGMQIHTPTDA